MKAIAIAITIALLLASGMAIAEDTGRGEYTTPIPPITNWLNTNNQFYHRHAYEQFELDTALGLGADIALYDFKEVPILGIDSINCEYKYDFGNEVHSVFLVGHFSLVDAVRGILQ